MFDILNEDYQRELYYKNELRDAREEGMKAGMKAGMDAGMKAGMKAGMDAGMKAGMDETALRMIKTGGFAPELISHISGLPIEEVNKLQNKYIKN